MENPKIPRIILIIVSTVKTKNAKNVRSAILKKFFPAHCIFSTIKSSIFLHLMVIFVIASSNRSKKISQPFFFSFYSVLFLFAFFEAQQ